MRSLLCLTALALAVAAAIACGHSYAEDPAQPVEAGPDVPDAPDGPDVPPPSPDAAKLADAAAEASTRFCSNVGMQQNTDIFCADFDGTDLAEGFTRASDAGLSATNVTALSAPNALLANGPPGMSFTDRGPTLAWEHLGNPISVLDVTVGINQPAPAGPPGTGTGTVAMITMQTELTRTSFLFSRGMPNFSIEIEYNGSAAYGKRDAVPINLVEGKWTKVNLVYNVRTGNVSVAYDGVTVLNKVGYYTPQAVLTDSKATVLIGALASGPTFIEPFRFDNLVARVTRE